jgi:phospholipid/cholesterol/gamma-HCH transport system substrate-binding protein
MILRRTKIQLLIFVIITLVGVTYVGAEYVGLAKNVLASPCEISADFSDSGGIFTNAEVTYRGVTVGRVGALSLIPHGVRVALDLDDCSTNKIPASSAAVVADRSVVGEQYVNLVPPNGKAPFVHSGSVIPMKRNSIPIAPEELLLNLNQLVKSVPLQDLRTTIRQLDDAVNGRGPDLGHLLDYSNELLNTALKPQNVNDSINLIKNSATVLQTQLDEQQPLQSWTHSLNLLSQQLKKSDPDIRHLFNTAPGDLGTVSSLIQNNRTDLGVVLANLDTFGQIVVDHLNGIEEILELYPALAAGGPTTLHNHYGALGLVLQTKPDPQDCGDPHKDRQGYNSVRRGPEALYPIAPDVAVRCTAPLSSGTDVRGAAHVPGGDPISVTGGGHAYPRVVTKNLRAGAKAKPVYIGPASSPKPGTTGSSWMNLLAAGVR